MKYIDEFRDRKLAGKILAEINKLNLKRLNLMEVCGTHTMAIFRNGLKQLLPENINLISGPGCPVCVTSQIDIDKMIALARQSNIIITTFGDMLRVPGSKSSLEKERANGAEIRIVYSPLDALEIARQNKNKTVIFLGVGFETTSPAVASAVDDAKNNKIKNFFLYSNHKLIPPAMQALLKNKQIRLDGFICPGHVSTIIGSKAYEFIARDYHIPCVISGFEPVDILESILLLCRQVSRKTCLVEIQYKRAVHTKGNLLAQRLLKKVFQITDAQWRGLGTIKDSGYKLNKTYKRFDAQERFILKINKSEEKPGCLCGKVLCGLSNPNECGLFAKGCTPENPYGPCMVSSEGTCAAWYKYGRS
ncbi:MAG: hydrogenase formation protein HypD [Candidatus Omnitrophota bacterium]